ncbi:DUF2180 family protein [Streptomyces sp. NPDC048385]|uniref:DUF2180 family protein n=1 Tax=unclassified Streptomyces TaxID=2593676 RepID=UPI003436BAA3
MNCYDCEQLGQTTAATAVCSHCGAAVCSAHAHVTADVVYRYVGMGPSARPLPARRITCTTCYDAEHSGSPAHGPARPAPPRRPRRHLLGSRR